MNDIEIKAITEYVFLDHSQEITYLPATEKKNIGLVFGTRHWQMPVCQAVDAYYRGVIDCILFSGGQNRTTGLHEAKTMAHEALYYGIPREDILIESKSTNTSENVIESMRSLEAFIEPLSVNAIIAIVKNFHARRALMTLQRHAIDDVLYFALPYISKYFTSNTWSKTPTGRKIVLGEVERIKNYLNKGDIAELNI